MTCPACQQDNPDGARFCNGCGTRLTAATLAATPQAYTPPHLADKILTARDAHELDMRSGREQAEREVTELGHLFIVARSQPAERRRDQLDQDLGGWGFRVAPRRHG